MMLLLTTETMTMLVMNLLKCEAFLPRAAGRARGARGARGTVRYAAAKPQAPSFLICFVGDR